MTAQEVLEWCADHEVVLTAKPDGKLGLDGDPVWRTKAAQLIAPLREQVFMLVLDRGRSTAKCGESFCAGCYEVLPGVYLHPPKSGRGDGKTDLKYKGTLK